MSTFKSTSFTTTPHVMPSPPAVPWNAEAMPWTISTPYPRVMEFNATSGHFSNIFQVKNAIELHSYKRKSDVPLPSPTKQFITEEKMAAHLNGLHISPDYVSHDTGISTNTDVEKSTLSDITMDSDVEYNIPLSAKDLEEKLRNASRITICDEIRKLNQQDTILPKALLTRIEKPCTALVLWQPPQNLNDLVVTNTKNNIKNNEFDIDDDEDQQNNNTSTLDYNCGMDTDMM